MPLLQDKSSTPSSTQIQITDGGVSIAVPGASSPTAAYQAALAARNELREQLEQLTDTRRSIAQRLREGDAARGADVQGLEARLRDQDGRIAKLEAQIEQADAAVAKAAAIPGAVVEPPRSLPAAGIEAEPIFIVFILFVLAPIAFAFARRLWKRGSVAPAPLSREVTERLDSMAQAVESIALEVERIGEGQRFITKVIGERQLGAGAAQPIEIKADQRAEVAR